MSGRTDALRQELLDLRSNAGLISARTAVQWAREHPESRLHASLNWDDETAAEEHRIWQVRQLISMHIVTVTGARHFVSLSVDRSTGGYRALSDVTASPELRAVMLQDAFDDLERVQQRYASLQELAKVWEEAAKVRASQQTKTKRKKAA